MITKTSKQTDDSKWILKDAPKYQNSGLVTVFEGLHCCNNQGKIMGENTRRGKRNPSAYRTVSLKNLKNSYLRNKDIHRW